MFFFLTDIFFSHSVWNLVIQLQGAVGALSHCSSSSVIQTIHRAGGGNSSQPQRCARTGMQFNTRPWPEWNVNPMRERAHSSVQRGVVSRLVEDHHSVGREPGLPPPESRLAARAGGSDTGRVRERQRGLTPPACRYPLVNAIPLNITLCH